MAGKNDFYISFGSNATEFSAALAKDLQGAQKSIGELTTLVERLEQAQGRMKAGKPAPAPVPGAAPVPPPTPPKGGGKEAAGTAMVDISAMAQDMKALQTETWKMVQNLGTAITGMETLIRRAVGKTTHDDKSDAATAAYDKQGRRVYRPGVTAADVGRTIDKHGNPVDPSRKLGGQWPSPALGDKWTQDQLKASKTSIAEVAKAAKDAVTTISNTPTQIVSEVSMDAVVSAIKNQTKSMNKGIEAIVNAINNNGTGKNPPGGAPGGGGKGKGGGGGSKGVTAPMAVDTDAAGVSLIDETTVSTAGLGKTAARRVERAKKRNADAKAALAAARTEGNEEKIAKAEEEAQRASAFLATAALPRAKVKADNEKLRRAEREQNRQRLSEIDEALGMTEDMAALRSSVAARKTTRKQLHGILDAYRNMDPSFIPTRMDGSPITRNQNTKAGPLVDMVEQVVGKRQEAMKAAIDPKLLPFIDKTLSMIDKTARSLAAAEKTLSEHYASGGGSLKMQPGTQRDSGHAGPGSLTRVPLGDGTFAPVAFDVMPGSRPEKRVKGTPSMGAAFGRKEMTAEEYLAASGESRFLGPGTLAPFGTTAGVGTEKQVRAAMKARQDAFAQIKGAARSNVMELMQDSQPVDFFHPSLMEAAKNPVDKNGKERSKADIARAVKGVRAVQSAARVIDNLGAMIEGLDQRWAALSAEAEKLINLRDTQGLTKGQTSRLSTVQKAMKEVEAYRASTLTPEMDQFRTPSYRLGLATRQLTRWGGPGGEDAFYGRYGYPPIVPPGEGGYEGQRLNNIERNQQARQNRDAMLGGLNETLFGGSTAMGAGAGSRRKQQLYPGVRLDWKTGTVAPVDMGQQRMSAIQRAFGTLGSKQLTEADMEPLTKALRKAKQALMGIDKGTHTVEDFDRAMSKFNDAFVRATGIQLPFATKVDSTGKTLKVWSQVIAQNAADVELSADRAVKAAGRKRTIRMEDMGANLNDPASITQPQLRDTARRAMAPLGDLGNAFNNAREAIERTKKASTVLKTTADTITAGTIGGQQLGSLSYQKTKSGLEFGGITIDPSIKGTKQEQLVRSQLMKLLEEQSFLAASPADRKIGRALPISGLPTGADMPLWLAKLRVGRGPNETDIDYSRRTMGDKSNGVKGSVQTMREDAEHIDTAIKHLASILSVDASTLEKAMKMDVSAHAEAGFIGAQEIASIKTVMRQAGIRWSKGMNEALMGAKNLDEFWAAYQKMLKDGTLKMTSNPGTKFDKMGDEVDARKTKVVGTVEEWRKKRDKFLAQLKKDEEAFDKMIGDAGLQGVSRKKIEREANRLDRRGVQDTGTEDEKKRLQTLQQILKAWDDIIRKRADYDSMRKSTPSAADTLAQVGNIASPQMLAALEKKAALERRQSALNRLGQMNPTALTPGSEGMRQYEETLATAAGGSKKLEEAARSGDVRGPRIQKALASIKKKMADVDADIAAIDAGVAQVSKPTQQTTAASKEVEASIREWQKQLNVRERLSAMRQVEKLMTQGQPIPDELLGRAAVSAPGQPRSASFMRAVGGNNIVGVQNAIKAAQEEAKGTPSMATLRANIAAAQGGAATAGAAGGGGAAASGRVSGGFDECCNKIVKVLNDIHALLKTGIPTRPATGAGTTTPGQITLPTSPPGIKPITLPTSPPSGKGAAAAGVAGGNMSAYTGMLGSNAPELNAEEQAALARAGAQQQKAASASIAEISRENRIAEAMTKVSAAAKTELEALKAAAKAGADKTEITKRMEAVYAQLLPTMQKISAEDRRATVKGMLSQASGQPVTNQDMTSLAKTVGDVANAGKREGNKAGYGIGVGMGEGAMTGFERTMFGGNGFWSRVIHSTGTFLVRNFTAGFVFGLTNALQDIIRQGIETEAVFVRVSNALEATNRKAGNMRTELLTISTDYGVSLETVYKTAAGLTGMFENVGDISSATRAISALDMISGGALSAGEGIGALSSITNAYGVSGADDLWHVADVLTVIQNRLGTNIEVTAEGLGRIAGLAKQLGLPLEDAATYIGAIAKLTNQTGSAAGEQFQRIIAVMQTGRGQSVLLKNLQGTGIGDALAPNAVTGMRDYDKALKILLANYTSLNQAQRENITTTLGGQRQAAALNALLEQGAKVLDTARAAHDANGQAQERMDAITSQLNTKIKIMQANFVSLGAELVRSGILNFFGVLLELLNKTVGATAKVFATVNTFIDNNAILGAIRNLAGFGVGLAATIWLASKAFTGMSIAIKNTSAAAAALMPALGKLAGETQVVTVLTAEQTAAQVTNSEAMLLRSATANGDVLAQQRLLLAQEAGQAGVMVAPLGNKNGRLATAADKSRTRAAGLATMAKEREAALAAARTAAAGDVALAASGAGQLFTPGKDPGAGPRASRMWAMEKEAKALRMAEKGSLLAATGMEALNTALHSTALWAMGLRVSLMAIAAVGVVVALNAMNRAKAEEEVQNAYKARFTEAGRNTKPGEKGPAYVGPGTDAMLTTREDAQSWSSGYLNSISDIVVGNDLKNINGIGDIAMLGLKYGPGLPITLGKNAVDAFMGDQGARNAGDFSMTDYAKDVNGKFGAGAIKKLREVGQAPGATVKKLQDAQAELAKGMDDMAAKVAADESLEPAQKAAILASLEETQKYAMIASNSLMAGLQGVSNVNQMLSDQMKKIDQYVQTMQTVTMSGGADMTAWVKGMEAIIEDMGLQEGNAVLPLLQKMKYGQLGKVDFARMQLEILRKEADSAQAAMLAALKSGMLEPEEIERLVTEFEGKVAAAAQQEQTVFDLRMQSYSDQATLAARGGDPTKAPLLRYQQKTDVLKNKRTAIQAEIQQVKDAPSKQIPKLEQELADIEAERLKIVNDPMGYAQSKPGKDALEALKTRKAETEKTLAELRANPGGNKEEIQRLQVLEAQVTDEIIASNMAYIKWVDSYARAQTRNAAEIARIDESSAKKQLDYILSLPRGGPDGTTKEQRRQAWIDWRTARNTRRDAEFAEAAAARQTTLAMNRPGDTLGIAQDALKDANAALRNARQFGVTSTQYQAAMQQVIRARQQVTDAVAGIAAADAALTIAMANAAGRTVKAAQLTADEAKRKLAVALAHGGAGSAEAINAQAEVVTTEAAQRDAIFNDKLGTIDFNMEMGRMTSSAAIDQLKEMLKQTNLTRDQRRQLLLKIKGLQDDVRNALTGSGFNISDIKLPTAYQVRRALALDKYNTFVTDNANSLSRMQSEVGAAGGARTATATSDPIIAGLDSVRAAVEKSGSKKVHNEVTMHNNIPTAEIAKAIVHQVMKELDRRSNMDQRSNSSTPRTVRQEKH